MNRLVIYNKTPREISQLIAKRIAHIRKRKKTSQVRLSDKSGVSLGSIKRFESSGLIALESLIKIAIALNCEKELEMLFSNVPPESIDEVINESN